MPLHPAIAPFVPSLCTFCTQPLHPSHPAFVLFAPFVPSLCTPCTCCAQPLYLPLCLLYLPGYHLQPAFVSFMPFTPCILPFAFAPFTTFVPYFCTFMPCFIAPAFVPRLCALHALFCAIYVQALCPLCLSHSYPVFVSSLTPCTPSLCAHCAQLCTLCALHTLSVHPAFAPSKDVLCPLYYYGHVLKGTKV